MILRRTWTFLQPRIHGSRRVGMEGRHFHIREDQLKDAAYPEGPQQHDGRVGGPPHLGEEEKAAAIGTFQVYGWWSNDRIYGIAIYAVQWNLCQVMA